jgi:5-methyltetrahydropteroyltriglutamate--homocysteine methyltransferase
LDARRAGLAPAAVKGYENAAVDDVLDLQAAAGLDLVTDGEQRRLMYTDPLLAGFAGYGPAPGGEITMFDDQAGSVEMQSPFAIVRPLRPVAMTTLPEFEYARARSRLPVKVSLPSPFISCLTWSPQESPRAYPDPLVLVSELAAALREQLLRLASLGCRHIQVDAPELLTIYCPEGGHGYMRSLGWPVTELAARAPDILHSMIAGIRGVRFSLHICQGNAGGMRMTDAGYAECARGLFPHLRGFHAVHLAFDDEPDFGPLTELPGDVTAVLGLVSTRRSALEDVYDLARLVDMAAEITGLDRLAVSTQCGFAAAAAAGNPPAPPVQEAKLRLVAQTAGLVWGPRRHDSGDSRPGAALR